MKKKRQSYCCIEHVELRRLLSTVFVDAVAPGPTHDGSSWANAYTDLQAALSVATSGTTIEVGQGTYKPTTPSGRAATFQLINGVTIDGGFAGYGTPNPNARDPVSTPSILSGDIGAADVALDNSYHVVTGSGTDSTALLDGFTITGGNTAASGTTDDQSGGGILIDGGSPTINDCTITNNVGNFGGGGIAILNSGSPTFTNDTISDNSSQVLGGGIVDMGNSLTLTNCTITGNLAAIGGAIYNGGLSLNVVDCTITGNTSQEAGGGLVNSQGAITMVNSVISGNSATTQGGGMYNYDCSPELINCTFSGNSASEGYGAIADGGSGAKASSVTLTNCILWGDSPNELGNSTATVTASYSDIEQSGFNGSDHNIDADPLFARNPGTNGASDYGNLNLKATSPAIDAGSDSAITGTGVTTDLDGLSRIAGAHVDLGAYETHGAFQSIIYVDPTATGLATGSDWADAYPSLTAALDYAVSGETIEVAQGTYKPSSDGNRSDTFQLVSGVGVEGGFAGLANPSAAQNVSAYPTILSGDIGEVGNVIDNSYNVVTANGTDSTAVLDGFTITSGKANGANSNSYGGGILNISGAPTINDCTLTGNSATYGGGMYNGSGTDPTLTNCVITGNIVTAGGGAMFNRGSSPTLINCVIAGNTAEGSGGIADFASTLTLTNCTITGNTATTFDGGGVYGNGSTETLANCILWGDSAQAGGNEIDSANGDSVTVTFSDIDQDGFAGSNNNIDADPMFVRNVGTNGASDFGDLHLVAGSPAIDVGSDSAISGTTTDLDGNPRIVNGTVDLGAYEHQILYVDLHAPGSNNGSSWANAFTSLQGAMAVVTPETSIDVAQGTYYPTTGTNRTVSFHLIDGVTIEGGFAGDTSANPGQRDVSQFATILSGDIGTAGDNSDNSYNVVTANNVNATAVLDGFTITSGYANGSGDSHGAGINVDSASPTINDCIITGNTALDNGGGLYGVECNATVTDCTFEGNTAGNGGGVANCFYGTITLENCTFSANSAAQGGGFYGQSSSNDLINCTFSDNTATAAGGAIFSTGAPVTVTNSILWADSANEITMDETPTVSNSDIDQDGFAGSNGNIDADPQFVRNVGTNGSSDFGDLHILGTSPAVNAGSNAAISGTSTDLDGNARIFAGTVDMGAYEAFATHLAIFAQPASTDTAGTDLPIVIRVEDQYGSIFAADYSTVAIGLGTAPSGATLGGSSSVATQNGIATFNAFSLTKAGSYSLTFSNDSLPIATSNTFSIAASSPASLIITQQPTDTTADQSLSPIVVAVEDQYGNLVISDASNVTLASAITGASATVAANHGLATFSDFRLTTAGTYTLSASDGSLTGATSNSFTVAPGAATHLVLENVPAGGMAGAALPTFEVDVEDQGNNIVTSDDSTITLNVPAGAGVSGTLSVMAQNGVATFSGVSFTNAQHTTLTASDGSLASAAATLDIIPADTVSLVFQPQPVNGTVGSSLGNIIVNIVDAYGNLAQSIANPTVTLAIASGPNGAVLSGTTTESMSSSLTFSDLSLNEAGTYTLSASSPGLPTITSDSFALTYSGPSLFFSVEPASAVAGAKLPAFTIETVDASGNLITSGKSKISLTLSSGGKLIGSANAAVKNGKAIFSKHSIQKAGTYTLTASDPAFASAVSTTFTISAGAAKKLAFDPQPDNVSANTPFNVSVELVDKYGNAVDDGSTVDLVLGTHPKTAASLNLTSTVNDGFADFGGETLGTAGSYTLKASDGKAKATSKKFAVS